MPYAVGFNNFGSLGMISPAGNDGLQRLHNSTPRGWESETLFMRNNVDEVWVIPDFGQELCEVSPSVLYNYCVNHGTYIPNSPKDYEKRQAWMQTHQ